MRRLLHVLNTAIRNKLKYVKSLYYIKYKMACDFMVLRIVSGLSITAAALVIQFFSDNRKEEDELKKKELSFNT
jgi:hypothetical protein